MKHPLFCKKVCTPGSTDKSPWKIHYFDGICQERWWFTSQLCHYFTREFLLPGKNPIDPGVCLSDACLCLKTYEKKDDHLDVCFPNMKNIHLHIHGGCYTQPMLVGLFWLPPPTFSWIFPCLSPSKPQISNTLREIFQTVHLVDPSNWPSNFTTFEMFSHEV